MIVAPVRRLAWVAAVCIALGGRVVSAQTPAPAAAPRLTTVRGVVQDTLARPIGDAEIMVGDTVRTRSDSLGQFTVGGLAPGAVELVVRRIGYNALAVPVTLTSGVTRRFTLRLVPVAQALDAVVVRARRIGIFGLVLDSLGVPLPGAEVNVAGKRETRAGPDGRFEVAGLEPATYLVRVRSQAHRAARFSVTLTAESGQDVRVQLGALPKRMLFGARGQLAGTSLIDEVAFRDLGRRLDVNRPIVVGRDVLAHFDRQRLRELLSGGQLLPANSDLRDLTSLEGIAFSTPLAATDSEVDTRVVRGTNQTMRRAQAVRGVCYFLDGRPTTSELALSTPADWIESVEISRFDDTGTLLTALNAVGAGTQTCSAFLVVWTRW